MNNWSFRDGKQSGDAQLYAVPTRRPAVFLGALLDVRRDALLAGAASLGTAVSGPFATRDDSSGVRPRLDFLTRCQVGPFGESAALLVGVLIGQADDHAKEYEERSNDSECEQYLSFVRHQLNLNPTTPQEIGHGQQDNARNPAAEITPMTIESRSALLFVRSADRKHQPLGYQACIMRGEMWPRRQKEFPCLTQAHRAVPS